MVKGSQLSQLKSALSQAGLNRQPPSGKKRKHAATSRETDKDKKAQRLQEINQKLNPFDVKVTKVKHDVGGRKLKGVTGKPQQSKQAGLEQRKKTLLKEHEAKGHVGGIVDRRFGENDPTMTPEERMLERFTKERQRASRGAAFNLEDEDELTHYGQSLSKLDDFDDAGLGLGTNDDEDDGRIDEQTVGKAHFGGFDDEEEEENEDGQPPRKKSKAEVMAEVIAKSKQHKYERQLQRQADSDVRHQLDQELDDIRDLLFVESSTDPLSTKLSEEKKGEDQDYDQHVRELALDKRAKPKDRTKTEAEMALEAKESLEKAERKRQRRMLGEDDSSDDDETEPSRKKGRRNTGGDDLEDDFQDSDEMEWGGLGAGLERDTHALTNVDERKGYNAGSGEEGEEGEVGTERDDSEEDDSEGSPEDSDEPGTDDNDTDPQVDIPTPLKGRKSAGTELPFTFPCPQSHDEFLSITEDVTDDNIPTVVQRIRVLHHSSLGSDNKYKLQAFTGVLIDYILHITSSPAPNFALLPSLLPHLHALTTTYPVESAKHFGMKLKLMQKNLTRGLSKGVTSPKAKTWPGTSELAFLWTLSHIWPTSDMNHHVISPSRLLMGSYLGLCRVRSLCDLASGLFLCTLFLQYEEYSKRLVPEAMSFLFNAIIHIAIHRFDDFESVPGAFPCPDFRSKLCKPLRLSGKTSKALSPGIPNLVKLICKEGSNIEQDKVDLLGTTLDLLSRYADMYKGLDGFIELFNPARELLDGVQLDSCSASLKKKFTDVQDILGRLLRFARQSRRPLALQAHKPIPIATYVPKFESASSSYMRKDDPDHERAAASKLRYQYKQERKGAIRELRKDARFLSAVKQKEQQGKDQTYTDRMNKVFNSLESERAEQKKMEREKDKDKKRAGRK